MPPDAKGPQPGKSAPQVDENLPKVLKETLLTILQVFSEVITVVVHMEIR